MADRKKVCGNCGNNKRIADENGTTIGNECAIDKHNIGEVECMEGVCDRWKKDTTELKCCPCCNGTAKIGSPINTYFISYVVKCQDCGLETRRFRTVAEAIERWNTRKPMDRIVQQLAAYMEECNDSIDYGEGMKDATEYAIAVVKESEGTDGR